MALREFDPVLAAQAATPVITQLDADRVRYLLICCCNDLSLLQEASRLIKPHYFTGSEELYATIWQAIIWAHSRSTEISFDVVCFRVQELLRESGIPYSPEWATALFAPNGAISDILHTRLDRASIQYGRELLQRFLYERSVYQPLRRVVSAPSGGMVPDIANFLDSLQRHAVGIRSMDSIPNVEVAPERGAASLIPANTFRLTGVPFIDAPLLGQRTGDCNGIIGVTGTGKTTMGLYLATSLARTIYCEARESPDPPGLVVFATYEEAAVKLRPRVWASAFGIARERAESMRDWNELSTQANLQPYERRGAAVGHAPLSETERYDAGRSWLNSSFYLLDMSGSEEFPNAGNGGVGELFSVLSRVQAARQQSIHTVIIDYAGLLVTRQMAAENKDQRELRPRLKGLGDHIRKTISSQFQCTAWVLHQIKGEAGKLSPTKLMTHHDAAECSDFAENMVVCGCMGPVDRTTGCRRLNWSKVRYRPNQRIAPYTLQINDISATLEDVTDRYTVDETTHTFMSRRDQQHIGGFETVVTPSRPRETEEFT